MASVPHSKFQGLVERGFKHNCSGQPFLPWEMIEDLVTPDQVQNFLSNTSLSETRLLQQFVCNAGDKGAKRVFLLLFLLEKLPYLKHMHQEKLNDCAFPIRFEMDSIGFYGIAHGEKKQLRFFDDWRLNDRNLFRTYQQQLWAPRFGGEQFEFNLDENSILPFLHQKKSVASGAFGLVFETVIHKAHLDPKLWPKVRVCPSDSICIVLK